MKTEKKGTRLIEQLRKKRTNTAKLVEKMPEMLLDYKRDKWEKKMNEEDKAK